MGLLLGTSINGADLLPEASAQEPADPPLSGAQRDILQRFFGGDINAFKQARTSGGIEQIVLDAHQQAIARASPYFQEFGMDNEYFLVRVAGGNGDEGSLHAVAYAGGSYVFERGGVQEVFLDRLIPPAVADEIADVIRRLYDPERHIRDDSEHGIKAFRWDVGYDFRTVSDHQLVARLNERLPDHLKLDQQTVSAALENLACAEDCGQGNDAQFLQALELLSRDARPYASEKVSAGIWYLANMKDMGTKRLVSLDGGRPEFDFLPDLHRMDRVNFLETIDYAVRARHRWGWAGKLPREQFLEYVLPARTSDEPLQPWRRHVFEALAPALDRLAAQGAGTEEVISFLNEIGAALFRPKILGWTAFSPALRYAAHVGKCQDEVGMLLDFCRASGIGAFTLFTPAWPNGVGNHRWAGYLSEKGELRSLMACEPSPSDPSRYMDAGHSKVYLQTSFGGVHDVTPHFTPTTNLSFPVGTSGKRYQLNVLNTGRFVSVAEATSLDGSVHFPSVGARGPIVYSVTIGEPQTYWSPRSAEEAIPPFLILDGNQPLPIRTALDAGPAVSFDLTSEDVGVPLTHSSYSLQTWADGQWGELAHLSPAHRTLPVSLHSGRLYQLFYDDGGLLAPFGFPFAVSGNELIPLRGEAAR